MNTTALTTHANRLSLEPEELLSFILSRYQHLGQDQWEQLKDYAQSAPNPEPEDGETRQQRLEKVVSFEICEYLSEQDKYYTSLEEIGDATAEFLLARHLGQ